MRWGELIGGEASGELVFGSCKSRPGDRGGRIGAPFAVVPCGIDGVSGVRTGGRGCSSMISAPASARLSRLAMLVGIDTRFIVLRRGIVGLGDMFRCG